MMAFLKIFGVILFAATLSLCAQSAKVSTYLKLVAQGKISEVKSKLPDLLAEYPNDPGVKLLHGVVIEDGARALEKYKEIVKDFPDSEWADDAYWRIVQYYAVSGDTEKAESELANFRRRYPSSEFLAPASDVVRSAEQINRKKTSAKEIKDAAAEPISEKKSVPTKTDKIQAPAVNKNTSVKPASDKDKAPADSKNAKSIQPITQAKNPDASDGDSKWGLQVGIYSTKDKAELEKKKIEKLRMRTTLIERPIKGKNMFALVIGDYTSKALAEDAKKAVEAQCKCETIVYKKVK